MTRAQISEVISEKSPVSLGLMGAVVGWVIAALMAYAAFDSRVAVLETQMQHFRSDVAEMKDDIKAILQQTR